MSRDEGQPLLVAWVEQVSEAGLPPDRRLLAPAWSSRRVPAGRREFSADSRSL